MKLLIEQRIWDYLDGNCSAEERREIHQLIETEAEYRIAYQELMGIKASLSKIEMEEPSMSFTRSVMEAVKAEPLPGSIKSLVDKRIIYSIAAFFLFSILAGLAVLLYQTDWQASEPVSMQIQLPKIQFPDFAKDWLINGFIFIDIIIGLYFADFILRRKLQK